MSVIVAIEEAGPCRKRITVEVPAPAVEAESQRVVSELRQRTRLPGFRKGKVPVELIRRRFREDIEQELIDRLVPRYWRQAEAESEIDALLPPKVEEVDLQPGQALTFTAAVETRPEISLGELAGFDLPELEIEPTPEEVAQALEELRRDLSEWEPVERRAARGDRVTGEIEEIVAEEGAGQEPKPFAIEVGDPGIWEELSLAVTGLAAGQQGEFTRRSGEGDEQESRSFRIRIREVGERSLPDLDDTLAERLTGKADLDGLRSIVRTRLRESRIEKRRSERQRAVTEQLRERYPLTPPSGVVDHEIEQMLREYAEGLAARGVDPQEAQVDWRQLGEQVRPQAERRVHARLLLDAAAEKLELQVTASEIEETLAKIAKAQGKSTVAVRQALDRSGQLVELRAQLRRDKAMRTLLGEDEASPQSDEEAAAAPRGAEQAE